MLLISLILAAIAAVPEHDPLEYAFISHAKIADESDGSANRWPNMAVLEDGRVLVVWSRQPSGDGEDAILASFSRDCGCNWTAPAAILATPGLFIDADPSIVVSGSRVQRAMACIAASSRPLASGSTASGLPAPGRSANTSTWTKGRVAMATILSGKGAEVTSPPCHGSPRALHLRPTPRHRRRRPVPGARRDRSRGPGWLGSGRRHPAGGRGGEAGRRCWR